MSEKQEQKEATSSYDLTQSDLATVLAALRNFQPLVEIEASRIELRDESMADYFAAEGIEPLTAAEIDALCERLNGAAPRSIQFSIGEWAMVLLGLRMVRQALASGALSADDEELLTQGGMILSRPTPKDAEELYEFVFEKG